MFETAELGQTISKEEYREREPRLREQLLEAQEALRTVDFPVILLFGGVDAGGKSETANLLHRWIDPRGVVTHAYEEPSEEAAGKPRFWRYWRDLPARGRIGIFLSAWYSEPLLRRVHRKMDRETYDDRLDEIVSFERTLAADGALVLKFWLHLGREAQRDRLKALEKDPLESWRVTERDWQHWKLYERFVAAAERLIMRTSTGDAPWRIVEGFDARYRSLTVGSILLEAIQRRLARAEARSRIEPPKGGAADPLSTVTVLSGLDTTLALPKKEYKRELKRLQGRLNQLQREARARQVSTVLVFEGWDAAGKGGAIRRVTGALDARSYDVIPIAAPNDEERAHHYLWRFWRQLPRAGRLTIFDRSWYGRVLVERVEGFASEDEWRRAYAEINEFEQQLVDHGIALAKFWIHITRDEQIARFKLREETPHKRWKLNEEDWRNRERWDEYALAINAMVERTSTRIAPWTLVEGNDKRYARIKVLRSVCDTIEKALGTGSKKRQHSK